jgi:RHH-type rel operon transcriptional repressor/antitoxin RelB
MPKQTVSATIDKNLFEKLNLLSGTTERKRSWLINKAIESYLEEIEDLEIALERRRDDRLDPQAFRKLIGVSD